MPERKIAYERLNHKADTGFLVHAPSLQRLYIDSALAFTDFMVPLDQINDTDKQTITVSGESREALMAKWLSEILSLFRGKKFLSKRIVFNQFDGKKIEAVLFGETYSPIRHGHVSEINALSPSQVQLGQNFDSNPEFSAKVSLEFTNGRAVRSSG